jgi:D-glycero-D-manno-heptose 1,7-bisphosphate phosphatase
MTIAVFLDRDGTLNVEKGYLRQVQDLELIPGVAQSVRKLNDAGVLAILTTNQTGAARGFYNLAHIDALHERLSLLLKQEAGAHLDAIFFCPHLPKGVVPELSIVCHCRKPAPGMIEQAVQRFPQIELTKSYMLGDKASDVGFAKNAGCRSILLKTGYGERVLAGKYQVLENQPDFIYNTMPEAVDLILARADFIQK